LELWFRSQMPLAGFTVDLLYFYIIGPPLRNFAASGSGLVNLKII